MLFINCPVPANIWFVAPPLMITVPLFVNVPLTVSAPVVALFTVVVPLFTTVVPTGTVSIDVPIVPVNVCVVLVASITVPVIATEPEPDCVMPPFKIMPALAPTTLPPVTFRSPTIVLLLVPLKVTVPGNLHGARSSESEVAGGKRAA